MAVVTHGGHLTHRSVWLLHLPTVDRLTAAHSGSAESAESGGRWITIVGVRGDGPDSPVLGWGECAALNEATYTSEWAAGAYGRLAVGGPVDPAVEPMAAAALEMAELDARLRSENRSLAEHLGTTGRRVRAGAVVGLGSVPETLATVGSLVRAGYERIKLKVTPDHLAEPVAAVLVDFPDLEVHADANGSLGADDMTTILAVAQAGLGAIEQPFGVENLASATELVATGTIEVIADEAIAALSDIDRLAAAGAATAVAIKPPKLGGLRAALAALDRVEANGLGAAIGGMLETGLGRHHLAGLAGDPRLSMTGDLSPARRWLAADPFADLDLDGGTIAVPARAGVAGDPDPETLERYTAERITVALG